MLHEYYSRIIISGMAGDSGKTIVSCGLLACFKNRGLNVTGFKKGPDYIDSAWLGLSSGKPARNLDTFMMGNSGVKKSFIKNADRNGINIIEGNRGLFDGVNGKGTHSTAELAAILQSPVIIVQDISKVTRTAAASILGCVRLGKDLKIEGVILNRVANERHAKIAKDAIEGETGVPVLGIIPKLSNKYILPERHLGLITPDEFETKSIFLEDIKKIIEENTYVSKIMNIAINAPAIEYEPSEIKTENNTISLPKYGDKVSIGYFKDKSFSFYYPENLEMLIDAGAELKPISLKDSSLLEEIDALYIGGGFPEINLVDLTENKEMLSKIKSLADLGLPIYAECGGLMYLANFIVWKGKKYPMTSVLPITVEVNEKPQGHGYCEMTVDRKNPFYNIGTVIKGHEFHYSRISDFDPDIITSLAVSRGSGNLPGRDGITYKNVFASYIHIHALAVPEWITGMIKSALNYKNSKTSRLVGVD